MTVRLKETITKKGKRGLALGLLVGALLAALLTARPANASATFTINNTGDPGDGNCSATLGCTLREAPAQ
jgi:hypothetical protein